MAQPRGRKPKPTGLKEVLGNPGHRPLNEAEPKPEAVLLEPPPAMDGEALAEWRRIMPELHALGLLSRIDRAALTAYCDSWAIFCGASATLEQMAKSDPVTRGLLIKTTNGNVVQNPILGVRNRARADMVKYAAEFGMTPSARTRINAEPPQEDDETAEFFGTTHH